MRRPTSRVPLLASSKEPEHTMRRTSSAGLKGTLGIRRTGAEPRSGECRPMLSPKSAFARAKTTASIAKKTLLICPICTTHRTITATAAIATLCIAFGSSVVSAAIPNLAAIFQKDMTILTLSISLFVLGFALGPLLYVLVRMGVLRRGVGGCRFRMSSEQINSRGHLCTDGLPFRSSGDGDQSLSSPTPCSPSSTSRARLPKTSKPCSCAASSPPSSDRRR